ncbi:hypothetical protein GCM10010302_45620 [Streptomyces polychromogenes]|uniref:Uncharacterized protein n=1 Tax=Streptomyces polychromogenes TaxID=67342 RepID=A0ABP3F689_9ACTN
MTPSTASHANWCPMIGSPVPGISTIGFGRSSVYGRSREPWPPARTTAWTGGAGNAAARSVDDADGEGESVMAARVGTATAPAGAARRAGQPIEATPDAYEVSHTGRE